VLGETVVEDENVIHETAPSARFAAVYGTIPRNGMKPQPSDRGC
jgi:hypothetical protein